MTSIDVLENLFIEHLFLEHLFLEHLFLEHGRPACLRSDTGPEMVSSAVQKSLKDKQVDTHDTDPGSPRQNGYCESFWQA
ncbi:MAG: DDE-type integrase/transposase/recombinase [Gammaproteobacteria bacterium]|nr:DDE-type integrase/transposase/recombinase [Gammaproteobacteria bacterium]